MVVQDACCAGDKPTCTWVGRTCRAPLDARNRVPRTCNRLPHACSSLPRTCDGLPHTCSGQPRACNVQSRDCVGQLGAYDGAVGTFSYSVQTRDDQLGARRRAVRACSYLVRTCGAHHRACSGFINGCDGRLSICNRAARAGPRPRGTCNRTGPACSSVVSPSRIKARVVVLLCDLGAAEQAPAGGIAVDGGGGTHSDGDGV